MTDEQIQDQIKVFEEVKEAIRNELSPEILSWDFSRMRKELKNSGDWDNGQRQQFIKQKFGHYNKAISGSFRAALARTGGKFRTMFESRIQRVFGDKAKPFLDRLSKV